MSKSVNCLDFDSEILKIRINKWINERIANLENARREYLRISRPPVLDDYKKLKNASEVYERNIVLLEDALRFLVDVRVLEPKDAQREVERIYNNLLIDIWDVEKESVIYDFIGKGNFYFKHEQN